uniref:Uncharacterized protein n=1 Tax=Desertifilum tharense IPPAS B-1220 TaxID=1781255 RepID=A0ACD5GNY7_9CYAN
MISPPSSPLSTLSPTQHSALSTQHSFPHSALSTQHSFPHSALSTLHSALWKDVSLKLLTTLS